MSTQEQMQARVRELHDYDAIIAKAPDPESVEYIFGYGSLIYTLDFEADNVLPGYVPHWKRVFWQNSTDHRGVPGAPGRTVTLVPSENEKTWGVAVQLPIDLDERRKALQDLEWREKQYDLKVFSEVYDKDGKVIVRKALTYVGSSDPAKNLNWGGPKDADALAEQLATAHGPSGPNFEYLYKLAEGLRDMDVVDEHVFDLERRVKKIRGD